MPDGQGTFARWMMEHLPYAWFVILAVWGGTASYIARVRDNGLPFSIAELIGEWSISGFSGLITAYLCMYMELSFPLTAVATGIAGHMGGRGIFLLEHFVVRGAKAKFK